MPSIHAALASILDGLEAAEVARVVVGYMYWSEDTKIRQHKMLLCATHDILRLRRTYAALRVPTKQGTSTPCVPGFSLRYDTTPITLLLLSMPYKAIETTYNYSLYEGMSLAPKRLEEAAADSLQPGGRLGIGHGRVGLVGGKVQHGCQHGHQRLALGHRSGLEVA